MLAVVVSLMMLPSFNPAVFTVPIVPIPEWKKESLMVYATEVATDHGLNVERFLKTIQCESGWNRFAVGDQGLSHGLAQFYRPLRDWGITAEQAYDPLIALPLMARAWQKGEAYRWTCWRLITI